MAGGSAFRHVVIAVSAPAYVAWTAREGFSAPRAPSPLGAVAEPGFFPPISPTLIVVVGVLLLVAVVRVSARRGRERALRDHAKAPAEEAPPPPPPRAKRTFTGGFPVVPTGPLTALPPASASYRVTGVSEVTGQPVELMIAATDAADAAEKARAHRVISIEVTRA